MASDTSSKDREDRQGPLASGLWSGLRVGLGVGVLGALLIVLVCLGGGFLLANVLGLDLSPSAASGPRVELSVGEDGCRVTRTAIESEPALQMRWLVTNLDGDPVSTEPAGDELDFRYSEYGVFEITFQGNVDGEFQDISNGVRVFCEPEDQE